MTWNEIIGNAFRMTGMVNAAKENVPYLYQERAKTFLTGIISAINNNPSINLGAIELPCLTLNSNVSLKPEIKKIITEQNVFIASDLEQIIRAGTEKQGRPLDVIYTPPRISDVIYYEGGTAKKMLRMGLGTVRTNKSPKGWYYDGDGKLYTNLESDQRILIIIPAFVLNPKIGWDLDVALDNCREYIATYIELKLAQKLNETLNLGADYINAEAAKVETQLERTSAEQRLEPYLDTVEKLCRLSNAPYYYQRGM